MPAIVLTALHVRRGVAAVIGRDLAAARKQTMLDTAAHWHRAIFPRHFGNNNKTAYGLPARNKTYLEEIKRKKGTGQGKFTYEVLSGRSLLWAKSMVSITGTARRVTVKATVPQYFTNPFIGTFLGPKGKMKTITQQPNKPEEVTRHNARDRADLQAFAQNRLNYLIASSITRTLVSQIG